MAISLYINLTNGVDSDSILCPAQARKTLPHGTSVGGHDCSGPQVSFFIGECTPC